MDAQAVSATRNLCQSGTGRTTIMASEVFTMTDERRKEIEQREFENYVLPKLEEK